jgi:tetratricopeptide (TPR) repeat protein
MRLLLVFFLISTFAFSQQSNQQIAYQYYINGEYAKAIVLYEELIDAHFSVAYYNPYYSSLLKIKNYKEAEYLAKKLVKKYPKELQYQLAVIIAQDKSGSTKKADISYAKLLKKLDGGRSQTINLANTFTRHEIYRKALDVYILSEKINPKNNFGIQKAQLFAKIEEVELMLKEYLNEMERNPAQKKMVTSKIQKFLDNNGIKSDKNYALVKKLLLLKVRDEQGRTDFTEMLIWLFMQNHQFKMALIQAKALDKRTNSYGEGVYDLAETFLDKEYFELAIEAYDYVIAKGKRNYLFIEANINKLYALTKNISIKHENVSILDNAYAKIITDLGKNRNTVLLLSNYAHFKAFYLHDLIAAENILQDAMVVSGIDNYDLAECKMEYADVLLLQGDIWESMLYYSQVEKDFKEHPIGHEAKLRIAKISYYQGDFQWAQAQLVVLKASTSKLIANNAMELSLLITDNYNLDTTEISMRAFANADLLHYQQKYDEAILKYDSILTAFSGHSLSDEIYMRKADIYLNNGRIEDALANYEKIEEDWGYDILADDALYKRAKIYDDVINDADLAMKLYEKILLGHNSSIYVAESRKRFRDLRGDNSKEE